MRINSLFNARTPQRGLAQTARTIARSLEKLSSGSRINSAKDDVASFAQSQGLESQIRGLQQVTRNINDGQSILTIADSVLSTQTDLVQRMRKLAVQASSEILSASDRQNLQFELDSLLEEFNRVAQSAEFNGFKPLDGSLESLGIQTSTNKSDNISLGLEASLDINTFEEATTLGTGQFTQVGSSSFPFTTPGGLDASYDFNGDGLNDIITRDNTSVPIVNTATGQYMFALQNKDASLTAKMFFFGTTGRNIAHLDMNNDSALDLVFFGSAATTYNYYPQSSKATYDLDNPNVEKACGAQTSLGILDLALANLRSRKSQIGALMSRLASTAQVTWLMTEAMANALSLTKDTDIAFDMSELIRNQILQQDHIAVTAPSHLMASLVLEYLNSPLSTLGGRR